MKYLFTYTYEAKKDSHPVDGSGASIISVEGTDKITCSMIFGADGAVSMVEKRLMEEGIYDAKVVPMGWFKFDE